MGDNRGESREMEATAEQTAVNRKPWLFTRENAREMSIKANAAKAARRNEPRPPDPVQEKPTDAPIDPFTTEMIAGVREIMRELVKSCRKSLKEDVDKRARALVSFGEVESLFSGRPKAGVLKPVNKPSKPRNSSPAPEPE